MSNISVTVGTGKSISLPYIPTGLQYAFRLFSEEGVLDKYERKRTPYNEILDLLDTVAKKEDSAFFHGLYGFRFWGRQRSMRDVVMSMWDSMQVLAESWAGLEIIFSSIENGDGSVVRYKRPVMGMPKSNKWEHYNHWVSKPGELAEAIKAAAVEDSRELEDKNKKLWKPRKSEWR